MGTVLILLGFLNHTKAHSITINGKELIEKINIKGLRNITGKGITIAILDTGINKNEYDEKHILKFKDFINSNNDAYDDNGHGSRIATIIGGNKYTKGIASDCNFVIIKAFDSQGYSDIDTLNASLKWILQNYEEYDISVINMSLGIEAMNSKKHKELSNIINEISRLGITIIAACGNGNNNQPVLAPSNHKDVICVGSVNEIGDGDFKICSFSRGSTSSVNTSKPDVYTYGSNISFWTKNNKITDIMSGTSYSAAIVSGFTCLLKQKNHKLANNEIKKLLNR